MGASGRIRPDVFLIRCVWGREDEAGLGAQCFIEIFIVLRFRSEGKSWSNALPIANKGCRKCRQRVGVELHGSVGVGGAVCKTTNKKNIRTITVRMFEYSVRESNPYLETENLSS